MRFWFDRGIAGFRIDVAHGLFHDDRLRDNPTGEERPDARFGQINELIAFIRALRRGETPRVIAFQRFATGHRV